MTALLGSLGVALAAPSAFASEQADFLPLLLFVPVLVLAGSLLVRFRYRGQDDAVDLFESILLPLIVAFPVWAVVAATVCGQAIAEGVRRNEPRKARFNVAQWSAAAAVGSVAYTALEERTPDLVAMVVALFVVGVVNQLAFSAVLALVQRQSIVNTLRGLAPVIPIWVGGWFFNLLLGLIFVAAYKTTNAALPLFVVPVALLYWTGRGIARQEAQQRRLRALQAATHTLAAPIDPMHGVEEFLGRVRDCFESEGVELVLQDGTSHRAGVPEGRSNSSELLSAAAGLPSPIRALPGDRSEIGILLAQEGWRDCVIAPVRARDVVVGALVSYNWAGFEGSDEAELAIFEALANEVANAIQRSALLNQILDERQKLSEIVGSTSDGIFSIAADGAVTSWNTAMEKITGHAVDEMVGTAHLSVLRTRDGDGNDVLLEGWSLGNELPTEIQITTKTGAVRWLDCSYSRTGSSEPSLIVVARDTTATRELDQMRREFIATASHELRTPIAPIKGFAHLLLTKGDRISDVERRTGLEVILRQAQRLERLAENILSVARIDGVEQAVTLKDLVLDEVVSRTVAEFRSTWADRDFNVDAEAVSAVGNVVWVEQILANLLSNAVRYSPAGSAIDISVRPRGDRVEVSVGDRGPGVPDDAVERIFDRFVRLDRDDTQAGSGLGLYIARQLAERMDGSLTVANRAGGGAEFRLSLPAQSAGVIVG